MGRKKPKVEQDDDPGAPEWMVTFSDCMTLLLTFFVLLLSFSTFDPEVFRTVREPFTDSIQSAGLSQLARSRDAMVEPLNVRPSDNPLDGSEDPTAGRDTQSPSDAGAQFRGRNVFIAGSNEVFLGQGTVLSDRGKELLDAAADYIVHVPNRVLISENRQGGQADHLGLERSWEVVRYLTEDKGLDVGRFNMAASSTLNPYDPDTPALQQNRVLEIVILEKEVYQ